MFNFVVIFVRNYLSVHINIYACAIAIKIAMRQNIAPEHISFSDLRAQMGANANAQTIQSLYFLHSLLAYIYKQK